MIFLIVDLEGTCCDDGSIPDNERETIEIGSVIFKEEIIGKFSTLVKPIRHPILTEFCRELTGIDQNELAKANGFRDAFASFISWTQEYGEAIFSSWGRYDPQQFNRDCVYHKIKYPFMDHVDLAGKFSKKTGRRKGHRGAMKILGITPEGDHHRGLSDAVNIAKMIPFLELNKT